MTRLFIVLAVLLLGLGGALAYKLWQQDQAKDTPVGGTGTVEGVQLDVVPRISARILKIHVQEGDSVQAGQRLVDLDCEEMRAMREEAVARVVIAEHTARAAGATARAA